MRRGLLDLTFEPELLFRIKALLRRYKLVSAERIQIGALLIDRRSYEIRVRGETRTIPLREFELLAQLASQPGRIYTREQLIKLIWGTDFTGDSRTVDAHVKRLRERFADCEDSFAIQTIRGLGYKLEVRIIVAVLIASTFLLSLLLIAFFTRLIVKPVKKLTSATKKIAQGDYRVGLETARKDEIGDLANHFSRMTDSIRCLDEMRQEFVANVSHEIQTPLTSIQGYVRAIREETSLPAESNRYLDVIESESRRLSSLSQQLLTLASLDKGDKAFRRSAFRLEEQIRLVLISLERQWTSRSLELEPDLEEAVAEGDPELLYEVWLNLISNAMKFSEDGGKIGVLLRRDARSIRVTV